MVCYPPKSGFHSGTIIYFFNRNILSNNLTVVHSFFEKSLKNYQLGLKTDVIRRHKTEVDTIPLTLHGKAVASAMQMAVVAAPESPCIHSLYSRADSAGIPFYSSPLPL